jgi:SAM-dependent methyltransferase
LSESNFKWYFNKIPFPNGVLADPMNEERRLLRAHTFDEIAELYDHGRRECPVFLIDDLFALAEIKASEARVLEVGCGTGQATLPLARCGCRIVCVEMGTNLARIARRRLASFPRVQIVNAPFENWEPNGAQFDIVFAVTSWHWIDPRIRYSRAAAALRPRGVLAFTSGGHAFPPGFDPFFSQIQKCYDSIGHSGISWPPPPPDEVPDTCEEIERSGYFDDMRIARRVWTEEFTADEYVAMMSTASDHHLMEPAKRDHLFAEMRRLIAQRPSGRITRHNLTILHVARKK